MSSSRLAITWRKPGLSTVSRRSVSASMMFTPALSSCERWKQKVMSSVRVTLRVRAAVERFTPSNVRRSRPRRFRLQLQVDRVGRVQVAGGDAAFGVDGAVGEERHRNSLDHAVGEVDHARDLLEARLAEQHARDARRRRACGSPCAAACAGSRGRWRGAR